jgi:hypothetical protein
MNGGIEPLHCLEKARKPSFGLPTGLSHAGGKAGMGRTTSRLGFCGIAGFFALKPIASACPFIACGNRGSQAAEIVRPRITRASEVVAFPACLRPRLSVIEQVAAATIDME